MVTSISFLAAVFLIFCFFIFFSLCYKRPSKKMAYIRSGYGDEQLLLNKNAFAFPIFHQVIPVNLAAQCLNISVKNEDTLLTKDLLKIDISIDFYVIVPTDQEHITKAAQTLGKITTQRFALKKFLKGKLVSGLREISASMLLNEMLQQQREFINKTRLLLERELINNGLHLESIAIQNIYPTSLEYYQHDNPIAAKAKTHIAEEIAQQQQKQSEIELKTMQQLKEKELDSEQLLIEIEQKKQVMRFEQQKQISLCQAAIDSDLAKNAMLIEQEHQQAKLQAQHVLDLEKLNQEAELDRIKEDQKSAQTERLKAKEMELGLQLNKQELLNKKSMTEAEVNKIMAIANAQKQAAMIDAEAEQIKSDSKIKAIEQLNQTELQKFTLEAEGINEITNAIRLLTESGFPERLQDNLIAIISGLMNTNNDPVLRTKNSSQTSPQLVTEIKKNKETNLKRDKLQALLKEANHSLDRVADIDGNHDTARRQYSLNIPANIEAETNPITLASIQSKNI